MTEICVSATDPIEVFVTVDDQRQPGLLIGWRDDRLYGTWTTAGGETHVGFVDAAQVERVAQP